MVNNLDSIKTTLLHRKIIKQKKFLFEFYQNTYLEFKKRSKLLSPIIEIGSGGGFIKEIIPNTITSDVIKIPGIDMVFFAEKMPFKNQSIGLFLMLDTFHHIKNPQKALVEIERCLKVGGKIIMTEPYNSILSKFIYQNFHYEKFDPSSRWKINGKGRLSDANNALPWIIFVRDRQQFEKKFPSLKIINIKPHTNLLYLASGGLVRSQLLPNFLYPFLEIIERILSPLNNILGLFAIFEIKKVKT